MCAQAIFLVFVCATDLALGLFTFEMRHILTNYRPFQEACGWVVLMLSQLLILLACVTFLMFATVLGQQTYNLGTGRTIYECNKLNKAAQPWRLSEFFRGLHLDTLCCSGRNWVSRDSHGREEDEATVLMTHEAGVDEETGKAE